MDPYPDLFFGNGIFSRDDGRLSFRFMREFTKQLTPGQLEKLASGQDIYIYDNIPNGVTQIQSKDGSIEFTVHNQSCVFTINANYDRSIIALREFQKYINNENTSYIKEFSYIDPHLVVLEACQRKSKQWQLDHHCAKQIEYFQDTKLIKSFAIVIAGEDDERGDWLYFRVLEETIEMRLDNHRYIFDKEAFTPALGKIAKDEW